MISAAPEQSASKAISESRLSIIWLTAKMGTGWLEAMASIALSPLMTGMLRSIVITSGTSESLSSIASWPFFAHPTTSISGS